MGLVLVLLLLAGALAVCRAASEPLSAAEMYGPEVPRAEAPVGAPMPRRLHPLPEVVNEPGNCPETCHRHGQCLLALDQATVSASRNTQVHPYRCHCDAGWVGDTCATPVDALLKHYLTHGQSPHPPCCSVCASQRDPLDRLSRLPLAVPVPGASVSALLSVTERVSERVSARKLSSAHLQAVARAAGAGGLVSADGGPVPAPVDIRTLYPQDVNPMDHPVTPCCVVCDFGADTPAARKSERKGLWAQRIAMLRAHMTHREFARAQQRDEDGCCLMCPRFDAPGASQAPDEGGRTASRFHALPGAHRPLRRSMRRGCCDTCPSQYWLRDTSVDADAFTPSKYVPKPDAIPIATLSFPAP